MLSHAPPLHTGLRDQRASSRPTSPCTGGSRRRMPLSPSRAATGRPTLRASSSPATPKVAAVPYRSSRCRCYSGNHSSRRDADRSPWWRMVEEKAVAVGGVGRSRAVDAAQLQLAAATPLHPVVAAAVAHGTTRGSSNPSDEATPPKVP